MRWIPRHQEIIRWLYFLMVATALGVFLGALAMSVSAGLL